MTMTKRVKQRQIKKKRPQTNTFSVKKRYRRVQGNSNGVKILHSHYKGWSSSTMYINDELKDFSLISSDSPFQD